MCGSKILWERVIFLEKKGDGAPHVSTYPRSLSSTSFDRSSKFSCDLSISWDCAR